MNIHHLELFYYVARFGGITEAVRNIPYGIQQPAVSGQVAQLEEYLGVTLFQRRPFLLTMAGETLFKFIDPFFSNLAGIATELQGGKAQQIRVGAAPVILRNHLPGIFRRIRKTFPELKIALREGYQAQLESLLQKGELDLAITLIEKNLDPGIQAVTLVKLPLTLLVETKSSVATAGQLWARDRIEFPLICLSAPAISKSFQQGLARVGVDWFPSIEVSSTDLIETYVANGFGIGVSVVIPEGIIAPGIRALPLSEDFVSVVLGALWRGKASGLVRSLIDELQSNAKRLG